MDPRFKVFVGALSSKRLPSSIENDTLFQHFHKFEPVEGIIVTDKTTQESKGYGFVIFSSETNARAAIKRLHGTELHGCSMLVKFARGMEKSTGGRYEGRPKASALKLMTMNSKLSRNAGGVNTTPSSISKSASSSSTPVVFHGESLTLGGCRLYVGGMGKCGLPGYVNESHIRNHFRRLHHAIVDVSIERHSEGQRSKGYGFLTFSSKEEAQSAIHEFNGSDLKGFKIKVKYDSKQQQAHGLGSRLPQISAKSSAAPTTVCASLHPPQSQAGIASSSHTIAVCNVNPASGEEVSSLCGKKATHYYYEADSANSKKAGMQLSSPEEAKHPTERLNQEESQGHISSRSVTQKQVSLYTFKQITNDPRLVYPVKVTHIPSNISEKFLIEHFQQAGEVIDLDIFTAKNNNYHARIYYKHGHEAQNAVKTFNRSRINGQPINVYLRDPIIKKEKLHVLDISELPRPTELPRLTERGEQQFMYPVKVTQVSSSTTESKIVQHFQKAGMVISSKLCDKNGRYILINFNKESGAEKAVEMFHGKIVDDNPIYVYQKHPMRRKPPEHSPQCSISSMDNKTEPLHATSTDTVLKLSSEQLQLLSMAIGTGPNFFRELCLPYRANSDVKIEFQPDEAAIIFQGNSEVVKGAHGYFSTQLKQYIPLGKAVALALVCLHPNLKAKMMKQFDVSLSGFSKESTFLKLTGHPSDIDEGYKYISSITSQFKCLRLAASSIPITPTLLSSAKRRFESENISVHICSSDGNRYINVYSFCPVEVDKLKYVIEGELATKYIGFQVQPNSEQLLKLHSISCEHLVQLEFDENEKTICIKGFLDSDVHNAFESIAICLGSTCTVTSLLKCIPEQMFYLKHLMQNECDTIMQILGKVSAQIMLDSSEHVCLQGSPSDIKEAQRYLVEGPLFQGLQFCSFSFTAHQYIYTLIEDHILLPVKEKSRKFLYLKNQYKERDSKPFRPLKKEGSLNGEKTSFTITIYSRDITIFDRASAELATVNPSSQSFPVKSPSEFECIKEKRSDIEQKYRVRVHVQQTIICIYGLTEDETVLSKTSLQGHMESTVIIKKVISLTCLQYQFMEAKRQEGFQKLTEKCVKVDIEKKANKGKVLINIEATIQEVRVVSKGFNEMLVNKFSVNTFNVKHKDHFSKMWQKRWKAIQREQEDKHDLLIEFSRTTSDDSQEKGILAKHTFTIYGTDSDAIEKAEAFLCKLNVIERTTMDVPLDAMKALSIGLCDGTNTICDKYTISISLKFETNEVIITAPEDCSNDLDSAEQDILQFVDSTILKENEVVIDDLVIALVLQSQKMYLETASELAKPHSVSVGLITQPKCCLTLKGTSTSLGTVKPLIEEQIVTPIQLSVCELQFSIDPMFKRFMTTPEFLKVDSKMRTELCVLGSYPNVTIKSLFLADGSVPKLQLDVCKGKFGNEEVDATLLPRKELSEERAKLVKEADCNSLEQECNEEVDATLIPYKKYPQHSKELVNFMEEAECNEEDVIFTTYEDIQPSEIEQECNSLEQECNEEDAIFTTYKDLQPSEEQVNDVAEDKCSTLEQECNEEATGFTPLEATDRKDRFQLQTGSTAHFDHSNNMSSKTTVHAVIPCWRGGTNDEVQTLRNTIVRVLREAGEIGLQSIALPDCSHFGFPAPVFAKVCLEAIHYTWKTSLNLDITRVCIVENDQDVIDMLLTEGELQGYLPASELSTCKDISSHSGDYIWLWEDAKSFMPYSPEVNVKLNSEFEHDPEGSTKFRLNGYGYCVDFSRMIQINEETEREREVKKCSRVSYRTSKRVQWKYRNDKAGYESYSIEENSAIEEMYQSENSKPLLICRRLYKFDFTAMEQINVTTHYKRSIRRIELEAPNVSNPVVRKPCVITMRGPQYNLAQARIELETSVKSASKSHEISFHASLEATIVDILENHNLAFEIRSEETNKSTRIVWFKGLSDNVRDAKSSLQEEIIAFQASTVEKAEAKTKIKVPNVWHPQTKNLELFLLDQGSPEWTEVEEKFKATLPQKRITAITRIQNMWLWEKYVRHRERLTVKNNGLVNEMDLFHGSRKNDPKMIYEGEDGFDMRFSAQGMWGLANYFAVNASYSDAYAYCSSTGSKQMYAYRSSTESKQMFLVKVLTGDSYECASDHSLRLPPAKTSGASGSLQFATARYDTVTGYTAGSHVYMTYDNDKAYPAYIIEYSKKGMYY